MKEDDKQPSFASLLGDVKPLKPTAATVAIFRQVKTPNYRRIEAQNERRETSYYGDNFAHNFDEDFKSRFQQLCAMRLFVAQEIDLHGFYVDEAHRFLNDLLNERRNRKRECWRIIHGKGKRSSQYDIAPLRNAILALLCKHAAIAAIVTVQDRDRRSGCVLVDVKARARGSIA